MQDVCFETHSIGGSGAGQPHLGNGLYSGGTGFFMSLHSYGMMFTQIIVNNKIIFMVNIKPNC